MYSIETFNESFIFVYAQCFSNLQWVKDYGINATNFLVDDYIQCSVLSFYKNVERLIVLDNNRNAIGFAHLCFEKNCCEVVGGILPSLQKTGKGIYSAVLVYEYLFHKKNGIERINIKVLKSNQASLKMNFKIGFSATKEIKNDREEILFLNLEKVYFPNKFTSSVLSRLHA